MLQPSDATGLAGSGDGLRAGCMTRFVALVLTLPFAGLVALGAVEYGTMFTTGPRERCVEIERERLDLDDDEVLAADRDAWPPSLTCAYRQIDNGRVWHRQQPDEPVASLILFAGSAGGCRADVAGAPGQFARATLAGLTDAAPSLFGEVVASLRRRTGMMAFGAGAPLLAMSTDSRLDEYNPSSCAAGTR